MSGEGVLHVPHPTHFSLNPFPPAVSLGNHQRVPLDAGRREVGCRPLTRSRVGRVQVTRLPRLLWPSAPMLKPPGSLVYTHKPLCRGSSFAFCLGPRPRPPGLSFLLCKEGAAPLTSQGYEGKMRRPVCTQMLSVCSLKGILSNSNLYCPFKKGDGRLPRWSRG